MSTNPLNTILRNEISRRNVLRLGTMSALALAAPRGVAKALAAEVIQATDWVSPIPRATLEAAPAALIPFPKHTEWEHESLDVSGGLDLIGDTSVLRDIAIKWPVAIRAGSRVKVHISIRPDVTPKPEGYFLTIQGHRVEIVGADAPGIFYAIQTLNQLAQQRDHAVMLPCGSVRDWPAFAIRGFMQDTGRNFRIIDALKAQIDLAAAYKLNVFHWHLTDRPAWRIQSRIYPQLNDPEFRMADRDPNATYSFDDLRDVIAYAKRRHV